MKFCQKHWDSLREAIDARGMGHLVSKSTEEVLERTANAVQNKTSGDPLMSAMFRLTSEALNRAGVQLMFADKCPQCFFIENCHCSRPRAECVGNYESWTGHAADDELRYRQSTGEMPSGGSSQN